MDRVEARINRVEARIKLILLLLVIQISFTFVNLFCDGADTAAAATACNGA